MKKKAQKEAATPVCHGKVITGCVFQVGPSKVEPLPTEAVVAMANAAQELAVALQKIAEASKGPEVIVSDNIGLSIHGD